MRLSALCLMMTLIGSGCGGYGSAPPVTGGNLIPVPPALMEGLRIRPNDDEEEANAKLWLWAIYLCITEDICPEA